MLVATQCLQRLERSSLSVVQLCRNVKQYPEAELVDGMLLLRIDAPLYFANVNPVRDALSRHEARALQRARTNNQVINFIIIDLSPVIDVDASAVHFFTVSACLSTQTSRCCCQNP